jgi:hypothetical protein
MKIEHNEIIVRDLVEGYADSGIEGIFGYSGRLNIRPPYQREFVYKDKQREAVIHTILKGFPLNIMYWVKEGDNLEVLDGQQRTISICQFINGEFSVNIEGNNMYYHNLTDDTKQKTLDYKLFVYICEGEEQEKLDWFKTINIAGERLTAQELRNAVYTGPWLSDAKLHFSKPNCVAHSLGKDYLKGSAIKQDYLEKVIKWKADNEDKTIEEYMSENQDNPNAYELWQYFQDTINWVRNTFKVYRREMKGIDWGILYNIGKDKSLDADKIEKDIQLLMIDEDVTKKQGIYPYIITGDTKYLSIRAFNDKQKREAYDKQKGICANCGDFFDISDMEADHIIPWVEGGKTTIDNLQMLCKGCNRTKGAK